MPADQLHTPDAQLKGVITRLRNLLDSDDPEIRQKAQSQLADLGLLEQRAPTAGAQDPGITHEEDAEVLDILTTPYDQRNYPELLQNIRHQQEHIRKLYNEALTDSERGVRLRRIRMLQHAERLVMAAQKIAPELRTFGCVTSSGVRIPGNDTGLPTIQFRKHVYSTSDPLAIARLLDYMQHKHPTDPVIRERNPRDVALVDSATGEFITWADGLEADEQIRESGGRIRRAIR